MILGKVGKFRSFKMSSRIFFWACLFFIFYIVASIFVFNWYFSELRANRTQKSLLDNLQLEILQTKKELQISKKHLALLEGAIHDRVNANEQQNKNSLPGSAPREVPETPVEPAPVEKVEKAPEEPKFDRVDIKELNIHREDSTLKVNFKLINAHHEEDPVSGYIHIIAMNKESEPPQLLSYPKVALRNGVPLNYKRGQLFFIKRFKTIRGAYALNSEAEIPSVLKVLVYDEPGTLIFKKEFEVKNVL
jgi:hypothetical protein